MIAKRITNVLILVFALSVPALAGDINGKVSFTGTAPKPQRIRMDADKVCKAAHKDPVVGESVVVNANGTLRNVIVYVKDGLKTKNFKPPKSSAEFDQMGCMYVPHVLGVQTGQDVEIVNSDPTLHNVHSLSTANPPFNVAQPKQGMKLPKKFDKEEIFKVKCEVHTWMGAYIAVFDHPFFAVTGDDGSFSLKKLPPGEYTLEAWHETYGTQTMKVKVDATGSATADFTFSGK